MQVATKCSISVSMPGHHTNIRANDFILVTPGCPTCNSVSIVFRHLKGITTREPHKMQLLSTVSSLRLVKNGFNSGLL